jgi:NADP-dependent 3-hydroxy acid dehydrogenase YdfG
MLRSIGMREAQNEVLDLPRSACDDFASQDRLRHGRRGNLGRAIAAAFERRGATSCSSGARRNRSQPRWGPRASAGCSSPRICSNQGALDWAVRLTRERFGRVDVLCNIAGGFRMGPPVHETSDKDWDFLMDINARTMLHAVRARCRR